jgi:GWxTD domain-containing protein
MLFQLVNRRIIPANDAFLKGCLQHRAILCLVWLSLAILLPNAAVGQTMQPLLIRKQEGYLRLAAYAYRSSHHSQRLLAEPEQLNEKALKHSSDSDTIHLVAGLPVKWFQTKGNRQWASTVWRISYWNEHTRLDSLEIEYEWEFTTKIRLPDVIRVELSLPSLPEMTHLQVAVRHVELPLGAKTLLTIQDQIWKTDAISLSYRGEVLIAGDSLYLNNGRNTVHFQFFPVDSTIALPPYIASRKRRPTTLTQTISEGMWQQGPKTFGQRGILAVGQPSDKHYFLVADKGFPEPETAAEQLAAMQYLISAVDYRSMRTCPQLSECITKYWLNNCKTTAIGQQQLQRFNERVMWANVLYSDYRNGWQTDRGAVFLLFGEPDMIRLLPDVEYWYYEKAPLYEGESIEFCFRRQTQHFYPQLFSCERRLGYQNYWMEAALQWFDPE